MKDVFLVGYKVKGIKTLNQMVSLSFYKKGITMPITTENYNIKGIYGMNGAGKSAIITSVEILKNLLSNENYLNNPMVQKSLEAMINKDTKSLYICSDFIAKMGNEAFLYRYEISLQENIAGKYVICMEKLSSKRATSRKEEFDVLFYVKDGEFININTIKSDVLKEMLVKRTTNLLHTATVVTLFIDKIFSEKDIDKKEASFIFVSLLTLFVFGNSIYVYMEKSDNHMEYFLSNMIKNRFVEEDDGNGDNSYITSLFRSMSEIERNKLNAISIGSNVVSKDMYDDYQNTIEKLQDFIRIFKMDLKKIEIDRKENGDAYICNLNMVYEKYSVNTEFESTGIKKLIKLFTYLQEMAHGGIVFIDELDSNLHDVYLCALLEYLMDYGEGQLCFTTHNVGPMDILKKHKKSIDFLSVDHKIYSWKKNGHYSPSNLYKNGMIEGSPFNVDSIDFIGVFDSCEED